MSAAIAGPAISAASPTLPSKNFFMTTPQSPLLNFYYRDSGSLGLYPFGNICI